MCRHINPELQKQMIREMAEEFRKWFRDWRRQITSTGDLSLPQMAPRPTDSPQATR
jgi:hypothetical protein